MDEQLKPCPRCGEPIELGMDGRGWHWWFCTNERCCKVIDAHPDLAVVINDANRRMPGPATKEALIFARAAVGSDQFRESTERMFQAFLDEWPEPAAPPTPEQPEPSSPWTCRICGEPVQIGDDLLVFHCLDTVHGHDAELSDADKKTLADGLRLTD